jgi:tetratricopeptide (TPR) repeat protein
MEYQDTTKNIPQIAKELGVANILEGGVQRSGNQVRINVQLIDAISDRHLWAETFDHELTVANIFAIQSEISHTVADALRVTLSPTEKARIDSIPTEDLRSYIAYLRGKQLMATRDIAKLQQSIMEFERSTEMDSEFALAWLGMADSSLLYSWYAANDSDHYLRIAEYAIKRVLAIDDQLGKAYASLGTLLRLQHKYKEAEVAFEKSIDLSPNYATAYHWYGNFLTWFRLLRINDASSLLEHAAELDPMSMIIGVSLGTTLARKGLLSEAEEQYLKLIELNPGLAHPNRRIAELYAFRMSEFAKAQEYSKRAIELDPGDLDMRSLIVITYLELGELRAAIQTLEQMVDLDHESIQVGRLEAYINFYQGNAVAARESINRQLPRLAANRWEMMRMGMVELSFGDIDRARQIYLRAAPGWLDSSHWPELLDRYERHGCVMSWILMQTGDKELGELLLQEATAFYDEKLNTVIENVEAFWPEICYLTAGDVENGLQSIENRLKNNDLYGWEFFRLPMYDLIRNEPRFQAAVQERNQRILVQREAINLKEDMVD